MPRSSRPHRLPVAVVLLAGVVALGCGADETPPPPPHGIVLLGLDTVRADGLSAYGNTRPTTPNLDALAARGVLFENAISNAAWTLPGFASILTGRHFTAQVFREGRLANALVPRFAEAGYRTAAFTEGGYVSRLFGFDRGFDDYWEERRNVIALPAEDSGVAHTFGLAADWLREHGHEPFFLFVHTYEAHVPYTRRRFAEGLDPGVLEPTYGLHQNLGVVSGTVPVGEAERIFVRALYDGGVAEVDRQVGVLLGVLGELGVAERTIVAVVSDHGEELGERDPQALGRHGHSLDERVLHVPLIVSDPRRSWPRQRIATQVRTLDLLPTLLDLAGIPLDRSRAGRSLAPLMRGEDYAPLPAYSQLRDKGDGRLLQVSVRVPPHKLVLRSPDGADAGSLRLYDLAADPDETRDVSAERPRVRTRLSALLQRHMATLDQAGTPRRLAGGDPEMRERLRALGYLAE